MHVTGGQGPCPDWGHQLLPTSECNPLKNPSKTQNCQRLLPQEIHFYEIKLDLINFITLLKSNIYITMETSAQNWWFSSKCWLCNGHVMGMIPAPGVHWVPICVCWDSAFFLSLTTAAFLTPSQLSTAECPSRRKSQHRGFGPCFQGFFLLLTWDRCPSPPSGTV